MPNQKKSKLFTAEELSEFKKSLLARRRILVGDASHLEDEALNKSRDAAATPDITKFADLGSDNYEQEFSIGLLENEEEALREIDAALERIKEGTFGMCEVCNHKIAKGRLSAIPYVRLCVECQKAEEHQSRQ